MQTILLHRDALLLMRCMYTEINIKVIMLLVDACAYSSTPKIFGISL